MWSRFIPQSTHSRKEASRSYPSFCLPRTSILARIVLVLSFSCDKRQTKTGKIGIVQIKPRTLALLRSLAPCCHVGFTPKDQTEPFVLYVRVCPSIRLPRICPPRCLLAPTMATMNSSLLKTVLWENQTIELFHPSIATPYCLFPTNRRRLDRSKSIKQACRDGSMAFLTF